ncbi:hypothetical protein [Allopusillimonas ginsengisoli]|uniref:hypothetical protein n=1 Tax=Allopusillimonas ginsengisoli TaxID=453575 RepID=UPI001021F742|nr:hypothetical protein [Allopusillimonas ginsengisoli]TEA77432.1 hypothetical protein ERE07_14230 [Allopusillimonas ginsengisoli]
MLPLPLTRKGLIAIRDGNMRNVNSRLLPRTNLYTYGCYADSAQFQNSLDFTLLSVGVRHRF